MRDHDTGVDADDTNVANVANVISDRVSVDNRLKLAHAEQHHDVVVK